MIWRALREPIYVFGALAAVLALTTAYAVLPGAPAKLFVAFMFASAKTTLVVLFFMRLIRSDALARAALASGLLWLFLLFLLSFADLATRG